MQTYNNVTFIIFLSIYGMQAFLRNFGHKGTNGGVEALEEGSVFHAGE